MNNYYHVTSAAAAQSICDGGGIQPRYCGATGKAAWYCDLPRVPGVINHRIRKKGGRVGDYVVLAVYTTPDYMLSHPNSGMFFTQFTLFPVAGLAAPHFLRAVYPGTAFSFGNSNLLCRQRIRDEDPQIYYSHGYAIWSDPEGGSGKFWDKPPVTPNNSGAAPDYRVFADNFDAGGKFIGSVVRLRSRLQNEAVARLLHDNSLAGVIEQANNEVDI